MREFHREYDARPHNNIQKRNRNWKRRRIDITVARYNEMVQAQGGTCAICYRIPKRGKRLAVDHDHVTGRIRGLLCDWCNRRLMVRRHTAEVLRRAADYISGQ
jgi:hypothetical protein